MADIRMPDTLRSLPYAAARIKEINTVRALLEVQTGTKLAFQRLPRHMRRRVMGHAVKRVPKRIKQVHQNQLEKSGLPPKQKRPSRKHRRRPRLLNDEMSRRQRLNTWLETHIWHAKRFHMIQKWSYKIPYQPTAKCFRACYRATMKHCLIQDVSYISCVQLVGTQEVLMDKLALVSERCEGLSMHAKVYINGNREGSVMLHESASGASIGNVMFHWKPHEHNEKLRTIWIWAHAAYFDEVLQELIHVFECQQEDDASYFGLAKITNLKHELNRFRLTGPLSQAVLHKALTPVNAGLPLNTWLADYLENDEQRQLFSEQLDYWHAIKGLQSPALLGAHVILSLIVTDPRNNYPTQRTKAINTDLNQVDIAPPVQLSGGALWNGVIRNIVATTRPSTTSIHELRSQLLVPGSELNAQGVQIPIMLIQRPGQQKTGFCTGWDLIIPKGWARSFWLCMIMWGARAGGYRETESINFELGQQPMLSPDTKAGQADDATIDEEHRRTYFKLPPNKRTNYNKFSVVSPFRCDWKVLLKDWSSMETNTELPIRVIRNKTTLQALQLYLKNRSKKCEIEDGNLLVPVKLTAIKGVLSRYTMICLPKPCDLKQSQLEEKCTSDPNQIERNRIRQEHRVAMEKQKRKRRIARKDGRQVTLDKAVSQNFLTQMRRLWLPEIKDGIRTSSSREVMGFIVNGAVSLANGRSVGIGYVCLNALLQFLDVTKDDKLLYRNTNSRCYQRATVEIIQ